MSQPEYLLHHAAEAEATRFACSPRMRRIGLALVVAFLTVAAAHNGNENYAEQLEAWTNEKLARPGRARELLLAPIWSKRCERAGRDALATRADRGPWKIHCIPRRVLGV